MDIEGDDRRWNYARGFIEAKRPDLRTTDVWNLCDQYVKDWRTRPISDMNEWLKKNA